MGFHEPPVARKLAVVCPTASFLHTGCFKFDFFPNACKSTSMLLSLHSTFMLSVVKMLLKGEVQSHALDSHGNYIVDHGIMEKSWNCDFDFLWEPCHFVRTKKQKKYKSSYMHEQ